MQKWISLVIILFLIICSLGCTLQSPESNPTYSILPEVLLDYDNQEDLLKIWVKSAISDYKYTQIKIELEYENFTQIVQDNSTYCVYTWTTLKSFNLTVQVLSEAKEFLYQASIVMEYIEESYIIKIFDPIEEDENIINDDDLPYKKVLKES